MGSVDNNTFAAFIHDREVAGQPVSLLEKAFPVGQHTYTFNTSTGVTHVEADPGPLPQS
jgi:hypothetical protein